MSLANGQAQISVGFMMISIAFLLL